MDDGLFVEAVSGLGSAPVPIVPPLGSSWERSRDGGQATAGRRRQGEVDIRLESIRIASV